MKDRKGNKLWIEYSVECMIEPDTKFDADIKAAIEKAAKKHGFRYTGGGTNVLTGRRNLRFYR